MNKYVSILLTFLFLCTLSCSTTVRITSEPAGAEVFINEKPVGKTPLVVRESNLVFNTYRIRLKLEGYHTIHSSLEKEFKPGPCIGGVFVLIPFLWVYGPAEVNHFVLEKEGNTQLRSIFSNKRRDIAVLIDGNKIGRGKKFFKSGYHRISMIKDNIIYNFEPVFLHSDYNYEIR